MICAIERLVPIDPALINDMAGACQARRRSVPAHPDWNHFRVSSSPRASRASASGHVRRLNDIRPLLADSASRRIATELPLRLHCCRWRHCAQRRQGVVVVRSPQSAVRSPAFQVRRTQSSELRTKPHPRRTMGCGRRSPFAERSASGCGLRAASYELRAAMRIDRRLTGYTRPQPVVAPRPLKRPMGGCAANGGRRASHGHGGHSPTGYGTAPWVPPSGLPIGPVEPTRDDLIRGGSGGAEPSTPSAPQADRSRHDLTSYLA
jgi:hypothetical protein